MRLPWHLKPLETAVNDAIAVAHTLKTKYSFKVRLRLNATRDQILSDVNALRAELTENDRLLIYYAGHGELDRENDTGYWLPVDAKPEDDTRWIANDSLTRHFRAMSARHILVVADSCFSGTLVRNTEVTPKTGYGKKEWLERVSQVRARMALVSGSLEPVLDGGGGDHSVFAKAFLEELRDNTGILTGQALAQKVAHGVVLAADQTPQYSNVRKAGHEGGDFIFVPKGSTVVVVTPPDLDATKKVDKDVLDHSFWEAAKDAGAKEAFEAYLTRFPDGVFAVLARLKLRELNDRNPKASLDQESLSSIDGKLPASADQEIQVANVDPKSKTREILIDYLRESKRNPKNNDLFLSRLYNYDVYHNFLGQDYDGHGPVPTKLLDYKILRSQNDVFVVRTNFYVVGRDSNRTGSRSIIVHLRHIPGQRLFEIIHHE